MGSCDQSVILEEQTFYTSYQVEICDTNFTPGFTHVGIARARVRSREGRGGKEWAI